MISPAEQKNMNAYVNFLFVFRKEKEEKNEILWEQNDYGHPALA